MSVKTVFALRFIACCSVLAAASISFAAGEFQPTRDSKTKIWNWTPKSGETASWSGDRDNEGYATGFGDLTIYDANGKVSGVYYGNMAHGRFEGPVNIHSGAHTLHAYFAAGDRVTGWARGRAPSNMPVPQEAEKHRAEAEKQKSKETKLAAKKQEAAEAEPTPVVKKEKPATEKIAKTETAPVPAESSPRGPETYHKQSAESSPTATAEKKRETLSVEEELKRTEPVRTTPGVRGFSEPTPLPKVAAVEKTQRPTPSVPLPTPASSQPSTTATPTPVRLAPRTKPSPSVEESPPVLREPSTGQTPEIAQQQSPASETPAAAIESKPEPSSTPSDVSVNALTGPPRSLRTDSVPEGSPEAEKSEAPAKSDGPLTESDAIRLADQEAASHGCPLEKYNRPKVDHSVVKGKWTLFYSIKPELGAGLPPAFSATVDDKTRTAQIHK